MNHPRFGYRDQMTGEHPTEAEWAEMVERARQILDSWQYASPEAMEWAMGVDPEYAEQLCGTVRK